VCRWKRRFDNKNGFGGVYEEKRKGRPVEHDNKDRLGILRVACQPAAQDPIAIAKDLSKVEKNRENVVNDSSRTHR